MPARVPGTGCFGATQVPRSSPDSWPRRSASTRRGCGGVLAGNVPAVPEADELVPTYHDVIEKVDPKEPCCVDEVRGDRDVLRARRGVVRGMVVKDYDVGDGLGHCRAEDLGGPYDRTV